MAWLVANRVYSIDVMVFRGDVMNVDRGKVFIGPVNQVACLIEWETT